MRFCLDGKKGRCGDVVKGPRDGKFDLLGTASRVTGGEIHWCKAEKTHLHRHRFDHFEVQA